MQSIWRCIKDSQSCRRSSGGDKQTVIGLDVIKCAWDREILVPSTRHTHMDDWSLSRWFFSSSHQSMVRLVRIYATTCPDCERRSVLVSISTVYGCSICKWPTLRPQVTHASKIQYMWNYGDSNKCYRVAEHNAECSSTTYAIVDYDFIIIIIITVIINY